MVSEKAVYGVLAMVVEVAVEQVQGAVESAVQAVFRVVAQAAVVAAKYRVLAHQQVGLEDEARLESGLINDCKESK